MVEKYKPQELNVSDQEVRAGKWNREKNRGIELSGKTIGIIGFGNNGSAFAKILQGFGVNILSYDKYLESYLYQSSMQKIYKYADIISLHIPLTKETNYLVDINFINKFKKNIFLINTSRGKCVNTKDLDKVVKSIDKANSNLALCEDKHRNITGEIAKNEAQVSFLHETLSKIDRHT